MQPGLSSFDNTPGIPGKVDVTKLNRIYTASKDIFSLGGTLSRGHFDAAELTSPSRIPPSAQGYHRHSNGHTLNISVSSTRSSDMEELPTSQPAAGEISWVDTRTAHILTFWTT
ncbi:hypothetical protein N7527_007186 [Penicillium freii]|nr:hypothetical protein N7527_007186 [Penicillium freii]